MATNEDVAPEPYILCGEKCRRLVPAWHERVQRSALALANQLDRWQSGLSKPFGDVWSHPILRLRENPETSLRVPLAVMNTVVPTLDSDYVSGVPVLIAEVMVGQEAYGDMWDRVREYLDVGIKLVWVLTPAWKTVTAHRLGHAVEGFDTRHTLTGEPELPGFSCPVADLFR